VSLLGAMIVGLAAGVAAGIMGIGGGVLFVPALSIFLDKTQIEAEATSLVAIVPVALVGAWRQLGYGNVRLGDGLLVGVLSPLGVLAGAVVANALSQRTLEIGFAGLMLFVAFELVRGSRESPNRGPARDDTERPSLGLD
jgi:uncharacterized membrane protein YfcA